MLNPCFPNMNTHPSGFPRRVLWHVLLGTALYWLGNIIAVFPWLISRTLGIIAMFLSVILWGYISIYAYRHAPRKEWNRDMFSMAIAFLITAVVQDYFLYVVYRGIPDELYVASTFVAYGFVFLLPFIVKFIFLRKYVQKGVPSVSLAKLLVTVSVAIIACLITLWSVKFW